MIICSLSFINIHLMSIIYALDDFDQYKKEQRVQLTKKYDIILLNIFPSVLESIIHDYIHDIIDVKITRQLGETEFYINIANQYINCTLISITFRYDKPPKTSSMIGHFKFNESIAKIICDVGNFYPYTLVFNEYMKQYYNKQKYINDKLIIDEYYRHTDRFVISCSSTMLICYVNHSVKLSIRIHNHMLFGDLIVMIKCIMEKIDNS